METPGAPQPLAKRIQSAGGPLDQELCALARDLHPTVSWWWGVRPEGNLRRAFCYVCDQVITEWSGGWQVPQRVPRAIRQHRQLHRAELDKARASLEPPQ